MSLHAKTYTVKPVFKMRGHPLIRDVFSERCPICLVLRNHWRRDTCHVGTLSLVYRGVPWRQVWLYLYCYVSDQIYSRWLLYQVISVGILVSNFFHFPLTKLVIFCLIFQNYTFLMIFWNCAENKFGKWIFVHVNWMHKNHAFLWNVDNFSVFNQAFLFLHSLCYNYPMK